MAKAYIVVGGTTNTAAEGLNPCSTSSHSATKLLRHSATRSTSWNYRPLPNTLIRDSPVGRGQCALQLRERRRLHRRHPGRARLAKVGAAHPRRYCTGARVAGDRRFAGIILSTDSSRGSRMQMNIAAQMNCHRRLRERNLVPAVYHAPRMKCQRCRRHRCRDGSASARAAMSARSYHTAYRQKSTCIDSIRQRTSTVAKFPGQTASGGCPHSSTTVPR